MFESHAEVGIDRPSRWAKQLGDHFAHKTEVEETPRGRLIHFSVGDGYISASDTAVLLIATGETEAQVGQVQDVLARHLERFAQREAIQVSWSETTPAG